jgi:Ricin-type beta-trefoil lectin domain/Glycosyl hydrolases family 18
LPRNGISARRGLSAVAVAATALALPGALYLTAPTAQAAAAPVTITGNNSGLCLSVTGASTAPGATADIYTCNGSASENWTVDSGGTITGNNSGLCLSVTGDSTALKTTADIGTCDGDSSEKWTVESDGTIVNGAAGLCLSVTGAATANYATADLYTCNSSVSEFWTVSGGAGTPPPTSPPPGGGTMGGFAPYADMSLYPQYNLVSGAATEGTKFFNLAFVDEGGSCDPEWGGVTAINDPTTVGNVSALEAEGGNVRVSFGGEDGTEIAQDCSSVSALVAAYQSVISEYKLTYIDFDIEGAAVAETSAINLRNQAIAQLEKNDPGLQVSYTLPVLPTGLPSDEVAILQSAKTYGATIAAVNVMAMDYGGSFPGDMATLAEQSATATAAQVRTVWTSLSSAQALAKVAVTPMIGVNDAGTSETFTLADATTLAKWAKSNGLAWTSFWSATRDSECSGGAESYAEDDCSSVVQSAGAFGKAFSAIYY